MGGVVDRSFYSPNSEELYTNGGTIHSSCVLVTIQSVVGGNIVGDGVTTDGLIAQSIQANCSRQPSIFYEIGTKKYYVVDARPQGQGKISNIIGPTKVTVAALQDLGNICKETQIVYETKGCVCDSDGKASTDSDAGFSATFKGGYLTSVTLAAQASTFVLSGEWSFMFADLVINSKADNNNAGDNNNNANNNAADNAMNINNLPNINIDELPFANEELPGL